MDQEISFGYGLIIRSLEIFDAMKILQFFDDEFDEAIVGQLTDKERLELLLYSTDVNLSSLLGSICKNSDFLESVTLPSFEGVAVYYPARLPWDTPTKEWTLTSEDIRDEMIHHLSPWFKEGVEIGEVFSTLRILSLPVPVL